MTFRYEMGEPRRLGRVLGEERRRQGITQADLADRARVSRGWLIRLEAGHRTAELECVFRVVSALGLMMTLSPEQVTPEGRAGNAAFESLFRD